jgi:hypothetical protein
MIFISSVIRAAQLAHGVALLDQLGHRGVDPLRGEVVDLQPWTTSTRRPRW